MITKASLTDEEKKFYAENFDTFKKVLDITAKASTHFDFKTVHLTAVRTASTELRKQIIGEEAADKIAQEQKNSFLASQKKLADQRAANDKKVADQRAAARKERLRVQEETRKLNNQSVNEQEATKAANLAASKLQKKAAPIEGVNASTKEATPTAEVQANNFGKSETVFVPVEETK